MAWDGLRVKVNTWGLSIRRGPVNSAWSSSPSGNTGLSFRTVVSMFTVDTVTWKSGNSLKYFVGFMRNSCGWSVWVRKCVRLGLRVEKRCVYVSRLIAISNVLYGNYLMFFMSLMLMLCHGNAIMIVLDSYNLSWNNLYVYFLK